ncbi:sugar ABC transporter permease [Streptomyces montanisoli]|uniref:Xylose transport system permease protein XylH n=1 Tax=Streptomyces montanisoli TaxID=2798581 RepID=A0A940M5W8_9ACTN|nr:sugar ABC transporter permease [Streptomyces montanisoli]MBP0456735.1 sugar ABC transporter permease [Streptomyces montanisoli]
MSIDKTSSARHAAVDAPGAAEGAVAAVDPRLLVQQEGIAGYVTEFKRKIKAGELGSIPVIVGLILIAAIFTSLNSNFLGPGNITNILVQMAGTGLIATGIVFVLLLGEIDLSVGSVSGLSSAIFAVLAITHGMNNILALVLALASGAVAGAIHGFFFARVGVPAFAVTLAGLLFWNGLMLQVLGPDGTINIPSDNVVYKLEGYYFSDVAAAYILALVAVVIYFWTAFSQNRRRQQAGVPARPVSDILMRTVLIAIVAFGVAIIFNQYKGLPLAVVIFVGLLVITDFVLRRTTYGRKVFSLGGSVEASRRAGINVTVIRITVFMIAGFFAALGGLFLASQIAAANQGAGAGNLLMNSIAAAVIGGTSLFGGRGRTWNALLGVLVIISIQVGLGIQGVAAPIVSMVTGAVLLATVVIDAITRKTQRSAGRA